MLGGAFELKALPNRAELRLKSTDTVIGYTLSLVRDDDGETVGAALFFKDLTHVEQMEERERLRDRLAAVGEMAAVMAHEIKNPLAGIEVLAGPAAPQGAATTPTRRRWSRTSSTKPRWPTRSCRRCWRSCGRCGCRSIARRWPTRSPSAVSLADGKATRGSILVDVDAAARICRRSAPISTS